MKQITRTIWILSLVSLLTDLASEMLYPVMPVYLKSIGFSIVLIGVLEGFAEAIAGLSKGYFGKLSDYTGRRAPFVQIGYALSAISKPMMAVMVFPLWIFFARTIDRFGKGIRTGARDAILSDEATAKTKGKIFGFHRSMDTFGAVLGPAAALIYLLFYPENYKTLFLIAFVPGFIAVIISLLIRDKKNVLIKDVKRPGFFSFLGYWKDSPLIYKKVVAGLLVFAMVNSSDIFLLLKVKQSGLSDTYVIGIYIFYNLVYALTSFPIGILADKIGLKRMLISGLVVFSCVYFGIAFSVSTTSFFFLFFLYGVYAAATEGVSKALISNITNTKDTATAIGTFSGFQSICTLIASSLTGFIWFQFGATAAFVATSIITFTVAIYFIASVKISGTQINFN